MNIIFYKKYGNETYHQREYGNIYEFTRDLNLYVKGFINRNFLNLDENTMIIQCDYFIKYFSLKFLELSPDDKKNLGIEIQNGFENINKLINDPLYNKQDEFYIFKYTEYIINLNLLYKILLDEEKILNLYSKFEHLVSKPLPIVLNTNDPIEEQVFYYQQELKDKIKDYFKEQLKDKPFSDILSLELDDLSMFPSVDFWLFGLYLYFDKINNELIKFSNNLKEYFKNYKNNFELLKQFQRYNTYEHYSLELLKDRKWDYLNLFFKFENALYLYGLEIANKNILIPDDFFLAFKQKLLEEPLEANKYIKIEFFTFLDMLISIENLTKMELLKELDELFEIKNKEFIDNLDKSINNTLQSNEADDVLAALILNDLYQKNITLDKIPMDIAKLEKILSDRQLIDKPIREELYNFDLQDDLTKRKKFDIINQYIKNRINELPDALILSDYYNKRGSIPNPKYKLIPEYNGEISPSNILRNSNNKKSSFEEQIPISEYEKQKQNEDINKKLKNNTIPNVNEDLIPLIADKNIKYMNNVAKNVLPILDMFPILYDLDNGNIKQSLSNYNAKQKSFDGTVNNEKYTLPKDKIEKGGELKDLIKPDINDITTNETETEYDDIKIDKDLNNATISKTGIKSYKDNDKSLYQKLATGIALLQLASKERAISIEKLPNQYLDVVNKKYKEISKWIEDRVDTLLKGIVEKLESWLKGPVKLFNDFLNSYIGKGIKYLLLGAGLVAAINILITAILCAIKALLCLLAMLFKAIKKFFENSGNFKDLLKELLDEAKEFLENLLNDMLKFLNELLCLLGLCNKDFCKSSFLDFLKKLLNDLIDFFADLYNEFINNFKKMVNQALECEFAGLKFGSHKFKMNFSLLSIPKNLFSVPKC